MPTSFKNIRESVIQSDRRYGPMLFYIALTLTLASTYWMCFDNLPAGIIATQEMMHRIVVPICLIRLLMMAASRPWASVLSLAVVGIAHLSYTLSHDNMLLKASLLILTARGTQFETTLRIYRDVILTMLVVIPTLYLIGYCCDIKTHAGQFTGHSWGFGNPNRLGEVFFLLTFAAFADLRQPPKLLRITLCCLLGAAVTIITTLCLSSALLLLAFPVIYWVLTYYQPRPLVVASLPWLALLLSVALMYFVGEEEEGNTFLSRFIMPYEVSQDYGLSWFGQRCMIEETTATGQCRTIGCIIDNGYLALLITHGIVPLGMMMGYLSMTLYRIQKSQQRLLLSLALCALLYSFMEHFMFDVMTCALLLFPFSVNATDSDNIK